MRSFEPSSSARGWSAAHVRLGCRILGDEPFTAVLLNAHRGPAWDDDRVRIEAWMERERSLGGTTEAGCSEAVNRLLKESTSAAGFVGRMLRALGGASPEASCVLRSEGLPELDRNEAPSVALARGTHELHAHFRGSIPFDALWADWMGCVRARGRWRYEAVKPGQTRAHRLKAASIARVRCAAVAGTQDEAELRRWVLAELEGAGQGDLAHPCEPAVLRYLVLLLNTRRALIARRGRLGLVPFTTAFERVSRASKRRWMRWDTRQRARSIFERFEAEGCEALELRPTLKRTRIETQKTLQQIVLGYLDYLREAEAPLAMGLVCSFFKQEETGTSVEHGRRRDADLGARLGRQQAVWRRQARSLVAILDELPALRAFVVGVDAAGRERGSPNRALEGAFDVVHAYNRRCNVASTRRGRGIDVHTLKGWAERDGAGAAWRRLNARPEQPLYASRVRIGFTTHAGEDFADPVTGLREIWESVHRLRLGDGDRIGHGIAVSLRPDALQGWIETRVRSGLARRRGGLPPTLDKPAGLHALDVAWSQQRVGEEPCGGAERLSRAIADAVRCVPLPAYARRELGRGGAMAAVPLAGVVFADPEQLEPDEKVTVTLDDAWRQRFERLRDGVEQLLERRGIVVESCPSSNEVVVGLERSPVLGLLENPRLRVVVGTDDPGLLEAWPRHELSRLSGEQRSRVLKEAERSAFVWKVK